MRGGRYGDCDAQDSTHGPVLPLVHGARARLATARARCRVPLHGAHVRQRHGARAGRIQGAVRAGAQLGGAAVHLLQGREGVGSPRVSRCRAGRPSPLCSEPGGGGSQVLDVAGCPRANTTYDTTTLQNCLSCTKVLAAVAVARLVERYAHLKIILPREPAPCGGRAYAQGWCGGLANRNAP